MRVTQLELFAVPPRWLFLKLSTDEGIAGWGEPIVEGRVATVRAAVEELGEQIIGRDPFRIEDHFQVMWRGGFYRGGPVLCSAISGIEQALWDIKGRALGVPGLGAARRPGARPGARIRLDRRRPAAASGRRGRAGARRPGLTAVKMNATAELHYLDVRARASRRRPSGWRRRARPGSTWPSTSTAACTARWPSGSPARSSRMPRCSSRSRCCPSIPRRCARSPRHTSVPIACGERLYTRWGFKDVLASGAVDIIQPDLSHAGGLLEARKIAAMAEAFDVAVAPHCPLGPIALAASLQLDACTPNAVIQEMSLNMHYNESADLLDYVRDESVFAVRDGHLSVPGGPGLGVEIDEERVREAAGAAPWHSPVWRNQDGTVAEW